MLSNGAALQSLHSARIAFSNVAKIFHPRQKSVLVPALEAERGGIKGRLERFER